MAKNELKDLINFVSDLQDKIDNRIQKKELPKIAEDLKLKVQGRMELGLGVSDGKLKPYKPLKKSTINSRSYKQRKGKLSDKTSPETSNQIETGQMHEKMRAKVSKKGLTISPNPKRAKVAEYQEDMGRITFAATVKDIDEIEKQVEEAVQEEIEALTKSLK